MTTALLLSIIALALFIGWCVFVAERESEEDYKLIAANKPVAHTMMEWVERAGTVVFGAIAILFLWTMIEGWELFSWRLLWWIPVGWAAFACPFRLLLNSKRSLSWWYMDDLDTGGNLYDEMWWRIRLLFIGRTHITDEQWQWLITAGVAVKFERQVARIAYGTELSVLAVSIALYIINT